MVVVVMKMKCDPTFVLEGQGNNIRILRLAQEYLNPRLGLLYKDPSIISGTGG
jgi:hypothetical protein